MCEPCLLGVFSHQTLDEWSCADSIHGHSQQVSLSCALLGKNGLSVYVQISVNAISVDKDFYKCWTEMEDVSESCLAI